MQETFGASKNLTPTFIKYSEKELESKKHFSDSEDGAKMKSNKL